MKAICLIDTSVFVNILNVPNKSQNHEYVKSELKKKILDGESMFLPMATILETGNHIAQISDGKQRRNCANRFVKEVKSALDGSPPFTPIDFLEADTMQQWLNEFPDHASCGKSLGDLSIIHDWKRQCRKNKGRRVYIWSLDTHLSGYDQEPKI